MINWSEEFATGNEMIDRQHKMFIQMINDSIADLCYEKFDPQLTVSLLSMYARMHFGHEEDCMFRHQCPNHETNSQQHKIFLEKLSDWERRVAEAKGDGRNALAKELLDWISDWLTNHILKTDIQLRSCILDRGAVEKEERSLIESAEKHHP